MISGEARGDYVFLVLLIPKLEEYRITENDENSKQKFLNIRGESDVSEREVR